MNPNFGYAHLLVGLSYRALNRGEEARVYFEKTLELEPDHPPAPSDRAISVKLSAKKEKQKADCHTACRCQFATTAGTSPPGPLS